MFTKFQKHFNVEALNEYDDELDDVTNFRLMFAGTTVNDGLFTMFKLEDIFYWRSEIAFAFPKYIYQFEPFAFDCLGNIYCTKYLNMFEPIIYVFSINSNIVMQFEKTLDDFVNKFIIEHTSYIQLENQFKTWVDNNSPLEYYECLGYINHKQLDDISDIHVTLDKPHLLEVKKISQYWCEISDMLDDRPYSKLVVSHYEAFLGTHHSTVSNIDSKMALEFPDFSVLRYPPTIEFPMWRYITVGMSDGEDTKQIELYMVSKEEDDFLIQILTWVAYYHKKGNNLWVNDTLEIGQPLCNGSRCDHALISYPYLDEPNFIGCIDTNCYWLLPITKNEVEFCKQHGVVALEEKFYDCELNFLDYFRKSSV